MTAEEFLERLEGVRKQHGGWIARCPAHEDGRPSLSIKEGEEGILLTCFAGCTLQQITGALDIKISDLFFAPLEKKTDEPEAVYVYTDEQNTPLYEVVRFPGKKFKQRLPDGTWGLGDVRRVLYNLPEVIRADYVVVTEGEKCADAVSKLGVVATCNVSGAGKWRPEYSEILAGKHVLVVADRDEPGRKHAESIRVGLSDVAVSVRVVQAKRGKDAFDHIAAGFGLKDFIPLRERRIEGVVSADQMADHVIEDLERPERSGAFYPNPWNFQEPEFVPGRLYVLGAVTAGGKTAMGTQIFRDLSTRGVRATYVTMEMSERDLRNRLLCHYGHKLKDLERPWTMTEAQKILVRDHAAEFREWNSNIIFSTAADHEYCSALIEETDCEFLIFDHLHQVAGVAGGEESQIAMQIRGFKNLTLDWEIPILVLSQFKRPLMPGQMPTITDFKGSSAIEQNANCALAIHRLTPQQYQLYILKNRDGPTGQEMLEYDGPRFWFTRPAFSVTEGSVQWK